MNKRWIEASEASKQSNESTIEAYSVWNQG